MNQAVIIAGGKGMRLMDRLGGLPKPLIRIGGKPLLEHQIELCRRHGCERVLLLVGYRADAIREFVGTGARWDLEISCEEDPAPLGTAGAVLAAWPRLADRFLVLYGDVMLNVDLRAFWRRHEEVHADASLLLHPNDHPLDSDLVELDADGWIRKFHSRPHPPDRYFANLVNAALYMVEKEALAPWRSAEAKCPASERDARAAELDFGRDLFPAMLRAGARLWGYRSPEYIKDIGTPERHDRVNAEYAAGVIQRSSLETPQPAVFLDRDGTLNVEVGGVSSADALALLPGVGPAVRMLNHHGLRAVVVTNQPVVAKGLCTEAALGEIHRKLETLLGREHAFLDAIYCCLHHPERGFPGECRDLKIDCTCRKPKPGLIHQAARELNLDLGRSWLIGDTTTDLLTARNAGVKAVLVRTGHAGRDAKHEVSPEFVFDNLGQAVHFIVTQQGLNP